MEAASDGYCRCCKKLFNREEKKHCVNLFGEKGLKEGIVDAVRKYGKMDITEEDIGFLSTSICQSCYLLVKGIEEKITKFANICQESSLKNENGQKRSVAERSPSQTAVSPVNHSKRVKHPDEGPQRSARMSLRFQPIFPKPADPESTEVSITTTCKTFSKIFT